MLMMQHWNKLELIALVNKQICFFELRLSYLFSSRLEKYMIDACRKRICSSVEGKVYKAVPLISGNKLIVIVGFMYAVNFEKEN